MMCGTRILKLHIDAEATLRSNARPMTAATPADISVAVGGGGLAVSLLGKGKPVLLLHGWTFNRHMWSGQYPLADTWQLVMPDRRGFGQSSAPPCLQQEYADIDRLIPAGRFAIIGFSQGATVAMDYARRYPERVAALVVSGAPLHNIVGTDPAGAVPLERYRELIAADDLAGMKQLWRRHRLMESEAANNLAIDLMLADYSGRDLVEDDSEIELTRAHISNLSMPVLALTGEMDTPWRCAVTQYIGNHAQSAESHIIAGAGHLCPLEKPTQFNRLIGQFIRSNFQ